MKLTRICFAPTTSASAPTVSALGGAIRECYVGMRVLHNQWKDENDRIHPMENARVSSIELDPVRPLVYVRQIYASGEKEGQPYRRQTNNEKAQPGEIADCIAVPYNDRCVLYFDDDGPDYMGSIAANLHNFKDVQADPYAGTINAALQDIKGAQAEPPKRGPGRPRKNPEAEPAGE